MRPLCTIMPRDYIIPFTLHSGQQKCAGTTPRTLQSLVENSPHLEAVPKACETTQQTRKMSKQIVSTVHRSTKSPPPTQEEI